MGGVLINRDAVGTARATRSAERPSTHGLLSLEANLASSMIKTHSLYRFSILPSW